MKIEVVKLGKEKQLRFTPTSSHEREDILKYAGRAQTELGVCSRVARILAVAMLAQEIHPIEFTLSEVRYEGQSFSIYPRGLSGMAPPEVVVHP